MIKLFLVTLSVWISVELAWAEVKKNSKFTNGWLAIFEGEEEIAQQVWRELGSNYKREVEWTEQQRTDKTVDRGVSMDNNNQARGLEDEEELLVTYIRKEAKVVLNGERQTSCTNIFSCIRFPFSYRRFLARIQQGNISKLGSFSTRPVENSQLAKYKGPTKNIVLLSKKISAYAIIFKDPLWIKQWYLQDYRVKNGPVMDHNVVPVYNNGFTGQGVTVAVVDHAIDIYHPDLENNIDLEKSYDLCLRKPLKEVLRQQYIEKPHGNVAAGIIAMEANNNMCGVGIAYNAKIAAINEHCEDVPYTEEEDVKRVTQNLDMVDIYNYSWGAYDDPARVFLLGELTKKAYEIGVKKGRKGKGAIYVRSAGNAGHLLDNCATDGHINHSAGIAITSATQYGKRSDYGETCTAIFATAYSGNNVKYNGKLVEGIVSTVLGYGCTIDVDGSSASCPIASGIIALLLSARNDLTYRDVMHIIARSAEVAPLADNDSWYRNGQGFWVSNEFGFGLLNAENMVALAESWKTVPEKHICVVNIKLDTPATLSAKEIVSIPFRTDGCSSSPTEYVKYLEHLEVIPIVKYPCRGDIRVLVISPAGTKSVLLESRPKDENPYGLQGFPIMSLHNWGENPKGKWSMEFDIFDYPRGKGLQGEILEFTVKFHGMGERPERLVTQREYAAFRLPNGVTNTEIKDLI